MLSLLRERGFFSQAISLTPRRDRLHIMPTSTGYDQAKFPGYDWDGRRRGQLPFSVLQHTLSGQGRLSYEGRDYTLKAGETMLVTVPHNHRYWVERYEPWEFFWIAMTGQEAMRLHNTILSSVGPVFTLQESTIERLADCCLKLAGDLENAGEASQYAYSATMALYDDLLEPQEGPQGLTPHHAMIGRVLGHIRQNLASELNIPNLAQVAGLSRAHFSRIFTDEEGLPIAKFILQERMRLAAKLLSGHTLSIKEIASACGFDDANYFAKVFRRSFGLSPSEFRSTGMYSTPR